MRCEREREAQKETEGCEEADEQSESPGGGGEEEEGWGTEGFHSSRTGRGGREGRVE